MKQMIESKSNGLNANRQCSIQKRKSYEQKKIQQCPVLLFHFSSLLDFFLFITVSTAICYMTISNMIFR